MTIIRRWTESEVDALTTWWVKGGVKACREHLPGKSDRSIASKAESMGLLVEGRKGMVLVNWTQFLDEQVKRAYSNPKPGAVKAAAKRLGISYGAFKNRARTIGCVYRYYNVPWTEEENDIVAENVENGLRRIQKKLQLAGYQRSEAAICSQKHRLGIKANGDPDVMTAIQLARLCGVDGKTPLDWIKKGWLKAKRGSALHTVDAKEGYLWKIKIKDFREFVKNRQSVVDLRKVDQPWFIAVTMGPPEIPENGSRRAKNHDGG